MSYPASPASYIAFDTELVLREHRARTGKILLCPADGLAAILKHSGYRFEHSRLTAGKLTLCDSSACVIRYQNPTTPAEHCRFNWELACELGRLRYPQQPRLYAAMFLIPAFMLEPLPSYVELQCKNLEPKVIWRHVFRLAERFKVSAQVMGFELERRQIVAMPRRGGNIHKASAMRINVA